MNELLPTLENAHLVCYRDASERRVVEHAVRVGQRVKRYQELVTVEVDGIRLAECSDVAGVVAWLRPVGSVVRVEEAERVLAVVAPYAPPMMQRRQVDLAVLEPPEAPSPVVVEAEPVPATSEPEAPGTPAPIVSALRLAGSKTSKGWRHDKAARQFVNDEAKRMAMNTGDTLDLIIWAWGTLSEEERDRLRCAQGACTQGDQGLHRA